MIRNRKENRWHNQIKLSLIVALLLTNVNGAWAAGRFTLSKYTIDGGTGRMSNSVFYLNGIVGQFDASPGQITEDPYVLSGGFWASYFVCVVDYEAFSGFAQQWLMTTGTMTADLDTDGVVATPDLVLLSQYWLLDCPTDWPMK